MTTIGKYRHLSQCSTPAGHFVILAIDHRANLLSTLNQHAPSAITDAQFTGFKQQIIQHLLPAASAVLTDPAYGIGPGIAEHTIGGHHGVIAPIEITDYDADPVKREIRLIPGWSVAKIKLSGGTGVKLLLNYHPEATNAKHLRDVVEDVVVECARYHLPFFLEPVTYSLSKQPLATLELRQIVVEMARTFSAMDVDILKLQFPADPKQDSDETIWRSACDDIDSATTVPWTLLSAGVDFETFAKQARIATAAGASGVMVGRAVWAEAAELQGKDRTDFLRTIARQRMTELATICADHAHPWFERIDAPDSGLNWYEQYGD